MSSVHSFTHLSYYQLLSYNLFYPSEKELRPVKAKNSIRDTIKDNNELFNSKDINSYTHTLGKPFRAVARAISLLAISTFIAPLGVIWNGAHLLKYVINYYQAADGSAGRTESGKKIGEYIPVFFSDLLCTGFAWGFIHTFSKKPWQGVTVKQFFSPFKQDSNPEKVTLLQGLFASSILFFAAGAFPKHAIIYTVLDQDKRAAVYKTLSLRNEFGIVRLDGGFLPYNVEKDNEEIVNKERQGHFQDIIIHQTNQLLWWIQHAQEQLPKDFQIESHYPPNKTKILSHLAQAKDKNYLSEAKYKTLSQKISTLFENLYKISSLQRECLEIRYTDVHGNKPFINSAFFPYADCPAYRQYFNTEASYFAGGSSSTGGSSSIYKEEEEALKNTLEELYDPNKTPLLKEENKGIPESYRPLYSTIKKALIDKTSIDKAYRILGLDNMPETERELRTQYKKCALATHPDKSGEQFKKESEALFKCVHNVFEYICKLKKWT